MKDEIMKATIYSEGGSILLFKDIYRELLVKRFHKYIF